MDVPGYLDGLRQTRGTSIHKAGQPPPSTLQGRRLSHLPFLSQRNQDMSSFTPINIPVRRRADQASSPLHAVVPYVPRVDQSSKPAVESGPGPPVNGAPELQTSQMPELPQFPLPQLPPVAQPIIQGFQAINAGEVIDLTGLSDDEDGDDWEDVPEVIIDLTNLSSEDGDGEDDAAHAEGLDGILQNYTILNLPPRHRYTLIDRPPIAAPRRPRRRARGTARVPTRSPVLVPARVPVRRDVCDLCTRVVRWGPGCLITKHHLYPQEITKSTRKGTPRPRRARSPYSAAPATTHAIGPTATGPWRTSTTRSTCSRPTRTSRHISSLCSARQPPS